MGYTTLGNVALESSHTYSTVQVICSMLLADAQDIVFLAPLYWLAASIQLNEKRPQRVTSVGEE